jgi:hypothetical protein
MNEELPMFWFVLGIPTVVALVAGRRMSRRRTGT